MQNKIIIGRLDCMHQNVNESPYFYLYLLDEVPNQHVDTRSFPLHGFFNFIIAKTEPANRFYSIISCTRPTWPSASITLMPCGWVLDFVSNRATMPSVNLPVLWSVFSTMLTLLPIFTSIRLCPFIVFTPSYFNYFTDTVQINFSCFLPLQVFSPKTC